MNSVYNIETYAPSPDENFFFDNNIWMFLYCPVGNYKRKKIAKYSGFLKKALRSNSNIYISSLILSEFFNSYLRLEFNILKSNDPTNYQDFKKDFRNTGEYKILMNSICSTVKTRILKISRKINDDFNILDIDKFFAKIEECDFNDKYSTQLSINNNFKIVTDDFDFIKFLNEASILTANPRLLTHK